MTFSRKLILTGSLLITALLVLAVVPLWNIHVLRGDVKAVAEEFAELKVVVDINRHVTAAKRDLSSSPPATPDAIEHLQNAVKTLDHFIESDEEREVLDPDHLNEELNFAEIARNKLHAVIAQLGDTTAGQPRKLTPEMAEAMDMGLAAANALSSHADQAVRHAELSAERRTAGTMAMTAVIAVIGLAAGLAIIVWQYQNTIGPLERLRAGVRSIAAGRFNDRVQAQGDPEFTELAEDFNHMAAELEGLYHNLEQKVQTQSRELVRSERLASVGFLAAGVAHEINNPLGIIAGYAELSLKQVDNLPKETADQLREALSIMRDESFRCKQIISKLLTLARRGPETRQPVKLMTLAHEVAALAEGLPNYRDRTIRIDFSECEDLCTHANAVEMRQVLLNLVVNAMEATEPNVGQITIRSRRVEHEAELIVEDNGCGMTPETLEHVFEPFFTQRRGRAQTGTGLGLSVTHAIIENHGGRIRAESAGPGRGSQFIVTLPQNCDADSESSGAAAAREYV